MTTETRRDAHNRAMVKSISHLAQVEGMQTEVELYIQIGLVEPGWRRTFENIREHAARIDREIELHIIKGDEWMLKTSLEELDGDEVMFEDLRNRVRELMQQGFNPTT